MCSVPVCPSQITTAPFWQPFLAWITLPLNGALPWLSFPDSKAIWQVKECLNSTHRCSIGRHFQFLVTHVLSECKASSCNTAGHYRLILRKVHHQPPTGLELGTLRREGLWDLAAYLFSPYLVPGKHRGREQAALWARLSPNQQKWWLEMIGLHLILLLICSAVFIVLW